MRRIPHLAFALTLLSTASACLPEENTDRIGVGEGGDRGATGGTASTGGMASGGESATGGLAAIGGSASGGSSASGGDEESDLFHLVININAENRGRIVDPVTGWECASTYTYCALSALPGGEYTLVAEPLDGFVFSGWTGDTCFGTGTCVVEASQAGTVELSAVFEAE